MPSASSRTDAHQLVAGDDLDQANQANRGGRRNAADTGPDREIIAALDLDQHLVTPQACHYRNRPRLASGLAFRDLHRRSKGANQERCSFKGTKNLWRQRHRCSGSFPVHHATLARTVPVGPGWTGSSARSSTVQTLVCDSASEGREKRNDMDSAKHCRDQSAKCLRLMKLEPSVTEARVLRDLAHSWVRLANQIDRYTALVKSNGPNPAEVTPQGTSVAPRSGSKFGVAHQRFR